MTPELEDLSAKFLEGLLLPEEDARLAEALQNDAELRALLAMLVVQETGLRQWGGTVRGSRSLRAAVREQLLGRQSSRQVRQKVEVQIRRKQTLRRRPTPIRRPPRRSVGWGLPLATAACLLIGFFLAQPVLNPKTAPQITGFPVTVSGNVRTGNAGRDRVLAARDRLQSGDSISSQGPSAEISIELSPGNFSRMQGTGLLTLAQGALEIQAGFVEIAFSKPMTVPFRFVTRDAVVEVTGTQLRVEVTPEGTLVAVHTGTVQVRPTVGGAPIALGTGNALRIGADAPPRPLKRVMDFAASRADDFVSGEGLNCSLEWGFLRDSVTNMCVLQASFSVLTNPSQSESVWLTYPNLREDWSTRQGFYLIFRGEGNGLEYSVELYDETDGKQERFEARFIDATPGWRTHLFPFADFTRRRSFQLPGAPDDGLNLDRIRGWSIIPVGKPGQFVEGHFSIQEIGVF